MQATGVWLGNSAWPSGASPGAFAKDVFRLEGCTTDRERAFAFNKWFLRCMNRGPSMFLPSMGGYASSHNPSLLFTSWGHDNCTGWGWIATEALQAAGMKARRAVAFNSGHTFFEIWYKGLDGTESWHAFDPFLGWYFLNDQGEVASCEELAATPDLVARPRPGGRDRLGHHPERSCTLHRYKVHDLLDITQQVQGTELSYQPKVGMTFANLWRPALPYQAIQTKKEHGACCDISLYDEEGRARYPEHAPYWKNYMWPSENPGAIDGGQPVRWHGSGCLRWEPLLWGEKVAWRSDNAIFEDGTVRPSGAKKHCEVWWKITLPYLASYLRLNVAADVGGGDLIGFAVSPDEGKTIQPFYWKSGNPPKVIDLPVSKAPGIRGMQEFWLRLDMSTQSARSPLRIRGLALSVGYQLNMNILPRLVPGKNELFLKAEAMNDVSLQADWAYTHPEGEKVASVKLGEAGEEQQEVALNISQPNAITMRGVTLRCLPK